MTSLPQPQVIDIDMGLGLDTYNDPKRVMPGKFTTLENVRFPRGKRLESRRGNVAYGDTYKLGNTGSAANTFGAFSNRLHVKQTRSLGGVPAFRGEYQEAAASSQKCGKRFFSNYYDTATALNRFRIRGVSVAGSDNDAALVNTVRSQNIYRPASQTRQDIVMVDSALAGTTVGTIWAESDGTNLAYYCDFRDSITGNVIYPAQNLMNTTIGAGWGMAVAVSATNIWFFYPNNSLTSVTILIVDVSNISFGGTANYAVASLKLDAVVLGSNVFVAGHDFDGGVGVVIKSGLTSWTTPAAFTAKQAYALGGATLQSLAIAKPKTTATKLRVLWTDATNGTRAVSFTASSGAAVTGPTTLSAYVNPSYRMTAVELGDEGIWWARSQNNPTYAASHVTRVGYVREAGTFTGATVVFLDQAEPAGLLCSRMLDRTDTDTASFWIQHFNDAKTESAYFQLQIQNDGIAVSAKQLSGRALPFNTTTHGVANNFAATSDKERVTILDAHRILVNSASSKTAIHGISALISDYDFRGPLSAAEASDVLLLGGGLLGQWDGVRVSHCGLLHRPTITTHQAVSPNGFMSNGTYSIVVVIEWVDAKGNRYQSAPSDPYSVTLSAGGAAQYFNVFIGGQVFVGPVGMLGSAEPIPVLYSTTNGGTIYYRASDSISGTLQRLCSDTDLQTREKIYTFGGVLPNAMPDGPPVIGRFNGLVIAASPNDDGLLYCQKPASAGFGVEMSDELTHDIDTSGGHVTAIMENVDKCIVFKGQAIQAFTGDGYSSSGEGGYSRTEVLYDHIGCPGHWAAISTPMGIMFDSGGQGIWLLGRDLGLTYVGEGVDSFKAVEVRKAIALPLEKEARFLLTNDTMLVYHWERNAWSVSTGFDCWDLGLADDAPIFLRESSSNLGGVYKETDSVFTDMMNGVIDVSAGTITMQAITSWLNFAGLQGYQRMWRALFTGDFGDVHSLLIDAGYDYDESSFPDSFTLTSANIGTPYDGQVFLKRSYSKALRFKLRASSSTGDTVGPMSLSGLSFELGLLPRAARMPSTKGA